MTCSLTEDLKKYYGPYLEMKQASIKNIKIDEGVAGVIQYQWRV